MGDKPNPAADLPSALRELCGGYASEDGTVDFDRCSGEDCLALGSCALVPRAAELEQLLFVRRLGDVGRDAQALAEALETEELADELPPDDW